MKSLFQLILLTGLFNFSTSIAQPVFTDYVEAELVSEVNWIQPGKPFWIALRMKMEPEWHIYWVNAGDSGLPPTIEWNNPEGFSISDFHWPYPHDILTPPLMSYGYDGEVFLMMKVSPPANLEPGSIVTLNGQSDWLVCKDICLPGDANLNLTLSVKNEAPSPNLKWQQQLSDTRNSWPANINDYAVSVVKSDTLLTFHIVPPDWMQNEIENARFYPLDEPLIKNADPQRWKKTGDGYELTVNLATGVAVPDTVKGVLVSTSGWRGPGSEKGLAVSVKPSPDKAGATGMSGDLGNLWLALIFAFLGGAILNLMPCVLPVLSLKVLGFVQQATEDQGKPFAHGLVFTGGVVASFWVLAAILLILRAGGEQLGWGFQLQSPAFIIVLSAFLFLFAMSLFGVFEIGTSLTRVDAGKSTGFGGSFLNGVTATVVATPCTAPFMGSALGFSLTQPEWVSVMIFTFLGLGMSAPYVILSASPRLLKLVPKPGVWMENLKQFMGFLLLATIVWLVWVLGFQAHSDTIAALLGGLLLLGLASWILGKWGTFISSTRVRVTAYSVAIILIFISVYFPIQGIQPASSASGLSGSENTDKINWEPYSETRIQELKALGTPYFIDFTAAWCLSCQVNDRVALQHPDVVQRIKEMNLVTIKADWTNRSETITRALANYGRNSVPVYVLHSGNPSDEAFFLPEILTPGLVLEKLDEFLAL